MSRLTENYFSVHSPMEWDAMTASSIGRFCDKCRKIKGRHEA